LSAPERGDAALVAIVCIPRDQDGPVFPSPWSARAFALAVALHDAGVFAWSEWADMLGGAITRRAQTDADDPDAYWHAWVAALEEILASKRIASGADVLVFREAWRRAAEATPHGKPIELPATHATRRAPRERAPRRAR
jgi:nitrile hydratase accessory protein